MRERQAAPEYLLQVNAGSHNDTGKGFVLMMGAGGQQATAPLWVSTIL